MNRERKACILLALFLAILSLIPVYVPPLPLLTLAVILLAVAQFL
jgi:hypothetical protein